MRTTFYLFRHGLTDWNLERRFQGHTDIPLNETGRTQAAGLPPILTPHGIEILVSSDLIRAQETAKIVATALKLPVSIDARLREAALGIAEGLLPEELHARFGTEVRAWRSTNPDDVEMSFPGGERGSQVIARLRACLTDLATLHPSKRIGVCTHGGAIRRLIHLAEAEMAVPLTAHENLHIPNACVFRLDFEGGRFTYLSRIHPPMD